MDSWHEQESALADIDDAAFRLAADSPPGRSSGACARSGSVTREGTHRADAPGGFRPLSWHGHISGIRGGAGWLRLEPGRMTLPRTGSCGPGRTVNTPMSTPCVPGPPPTSL